MILLDTNICIYIINTKQRREMLAHTQLTLNFD